METQRGMPTLWTYVEWIVDHATTIIVSAVVLTALAALATTRLHVTLDLDRNLLAQTRPRFILPQGSSGSSVKTRRSCG